MKINTQFSRSFIEPIKRHRNFVSFMLILVGICVFCAILAGIKFNKSSLLISFSNVTIVKFLRGSSGFGGMLFSVGISTAFCYYVGAEAHSLYYGILAAMVAVISQIGDLIESAIKRSLNLKDSSDLIPGHGGVFDRIDGLIFAAPVVYVFFRYVLFLI